MPLFLSPIVIQVASNPGAGAGTPGSIGIQANATDGTGLYYKFGALDTDWILVNTGASGNFNIRGGWDASVNTYPSSGGSGPSGAIRKGDWWYVSVDGMMGGFNVYSATSQPDANTVVALIDNANPTTNTDWNIGQYLIGQSDFVFQTAQDTSNNGYVSTTTSWKINFFNALGTFKSFFTNANIAARTYTFQDRTGTIADTKDVIENGKISATASGTDTYTATISPAIAAYVTNQRFQITFTNANTGGSTINLNALGAKTLVKNGNVALTLGDIPAGVVLVIIYDGTNFQIVGSGNVGGKVTSATVSTTDATQTTIETIAIPSGDVVLLESRISAKKTGGAGVGTTGDGNAYIRTVKAKNVGGTVTIGTIQTSFTSEDISGFSATFTVSGTNILVRVTGAASDNVNWKSTTTTNTVN